MAGPRSRAVLFWPLVVGIVVADVVTKRLAEQHLSQLMQPWEIIGEYVRLTLVYNRGAAFGLHVGPYSRWVFLILTVVALVILGRLYRATRAEDRLRTFALALVCAGAVGNLIDRVRSSAGVVDFLDIGVGALRWPTFNVADIAVSSGAFLLAWALWGEDEVAAASGEQRTQPVATANPE